MDATTETWRAFGALATTLGPTPGALEAWHRGRSRYAVWLLRVTDPAVHARQAAVAARLGGAIVPVPPADAHVTVWVCGFPCAGAPTRDDDVSEHHLHAQRAAVRPLRPPRLLLGAPSAFATCAFLDVHDPDGDLAALRARLASAGAPEVRFAPYQPHVTVGRFADTRPAAPIAAALAALRADWPPPAAIAPAVLELVELDARAPHRMRTRWPETEPLTPAAAAPAP